MESKRSTDSGLNLTTASMTATSPVQISFGRTATEDDKGTLTSTSSITFQLTTASAQIARIRAEDQTVTLSHISHEVSELEYGESIIETLSDRLSTAFKTGDEKVFAEIKAKIIAKPELLNQTDENNRSLFFTILLAAKGRQFLLDNLNLLDAVTATTLNAIIKNDPPFNGASPVSYLFNNLTGIEIVDRHPHLNKIISAKALNSPTTDETKAGEIFNTTPILYIVRRPEGRALLIKHPHIVTQFADGLFTPAMRNNQIDSCPVEELLGGDGELIRRFPHMFDNVSPELLNNGRYELGSLQGTYILSLFAGTNLGRTALLNSSKLRSKITLRGLFNENEEGPNEGKIPLHLLLGSDEGKKIIVFLLNENESLRKQIHELLSDPIKSAPNPTLLHQVFSLPGLTIATSTVSGRISPNLFPGVPQASGSYSSPLAPDPAAKQQQGPP